ncbi:MAG: serine--tRNA ligase [Calditrichaeota bacterium]|nr:serine--tRNA ligase [Calditrichota bacterium]MCB9366546.1 serine--tRNA ligase [Calditrichota bacterium]MCB9391196.1 serine--tRNA ligase [Calditrichota bacterium]
MIDIRIIRDNEAEARRLLELRGQSDLLDGLVELDRKRRALIENTNALKARRNELSREIAEASKRGETVTALKDESRGIGDSIASGDEELKAVDAEVQSRLMQIPNLPHESVPPGRTADDNIVVREWGKKPSFEFTPKDHLELGRNLGIFDFERGTKIAGSGYPVFKAAGAVVERSLINFFLDFHRERGTYTEVSVPFLVNPESMTGTGQLPKFEDDLYRCKNDDLYLIPTAEVPITNLHRDEILPESTLPICYCGYTPCFRREAGSYGKDTRGFLRLHQFDKVEMVKFCRPEDSYQEHEALTKDATDLLEVLGIHYRQVLLCAGDMGFGAAKCYDIEIWSPGEARWLEVSSCSNFESFQARRANIKFRRTDTGKTDYVHTLNGSGLATPRLLVAMLETYQNDDGTVSVPDVLKKYTGFGLMTPGGAR